MSVMGAKKVKLGVNELALGMYVSGLDRPWSQTPFAVEGFYLRDLEALRQIKSLCHYVYIDPVRGRAPLAAGLPRAEPKPVKPKLPERQTKGILLHETLAPLKIQRNVYRELQPLPKEAKLAEPLYSKLTQALTELTEGVKQQPGAISLDRLSHLASDLVDSLLRNPDAFIWLACVPTQSQLRCSHVLRTCTWAMVLGRHLGLPKRDLEVLALGVLLKDLGKTLLDLDLQDSSDRESESVRESFVERGCELLRQIPGVEPRVISVVKTHCERLNASGYPQHLVGDKIPLLGKIAGLVTFYDQILWPQGQSHSLAPSKAVARLSDVRNTLFQEELVIEFIRAIGWYPTCSLVELSRGEVAVVVQQNLERRLKPKVLVVLDALKQPLPSAVLLDLAQEESSQKLWGFGKNSQGLLLGHDIARELESRHYAIDVAQVYQQYLAKADNSGSMGLLRRFKNS